MKKIAIVMTALALMAANVGQAQNTNNNRPPQRTMGAGAQTARTGVVDDFAWGIGLGALAIVGVVVGVTVAAAVQNTGSGHHH